MAFKNINVISLEDAVQGLNDTQRGNFLPISKLLCVFITIDELKIVFEELAKLVPEWLKINEHQGRKILRVSKNLNSFYVKQKIIEGLAKEKNVI